MAVPAGVPDGEAGVLASGSQQKQDLLEDIYIHPFAEGGLLVGDQLNRLLERDIPAGKVNRAVQLKMVYWIHSNKVAIGSNVTSFFNGAVSSRT